MSGTRKPNGRSSIYLGGDGKWHGWVTMGVRADGRPDRRHRTGATETEVTRKVRELEAKLGVYPPGLGVVSWVVFLMAALPTS